jgi:hypothetical protein
MSEHADPVPRLYALRGAKDEGVAHRITRAAFLRCVGADPRTLALFGFWSDQTGVDAVLDDMIALLDAAARRAGLAHRSALRRQEHASHLLPVLGFLQHHEARYERLLEQTQADRAQQAIGFVVAVLFDTLVDEEVPIRAWLANDLLTMFRWSIAGRVYGECAQLRVGLSATLDAAPKANRPKLQGQHLEDGATWYYRRYVGVPRATDAAIAREHNDEVGRSLAPKDYRPGILDRVDTGKVRSRIRNAKRLLELPYPPEQWAEYFTKSGASVGEKLPS